MKKYEWKMKSFAKGIEPDLAVEEFERIEGLYGSLTAEHILKAAEPEDSILHPLFEWDDDKAAEKYRLQQARSIINNIEVKIVADGAARNIAVYEIVNLGENRAYKHIESLTPNDVEWIRKSTLRELNSVKLKLAVYSKFNAALKHIDLAIESI